MRHLLMLCLALSSAAALAQELAPHGVRVVIVEPGAFRTGISQRARQAADRGSAQVYDQGWAGLDGWAEWHGSASADPVGAVDVIVAAWEMGAYLGAGVLEQGIDACVSSWQRFAPNTIPAGAKAGGNYLSGQLVAREARRLGFGEGIALASTGLISEGAGENLFLVFNGTLHTTPVSAALLNGITRHTLMTLAQDVGIKVVERDLAGERLVHHQLPPIVSAIPLAAEMVLFRPPPMNEPMKR